MVCSPETFSHHINWIAIWFGTCKLNTLLTGVLSSKKNSCNELSKYLYFNYIDICNWFHRFMVTVLDTYRKQDLIETFARSMGITRPCGNLWKSQVKVKNIFKTCKKLKNTQLGGYILQRIKNDIRCFIGYSLRYS